jgi:very-short-patch-repair endonuclease
MAIVKDDATWIHDRARELRRQQTPAEQALWQQLRAKRFSNFKFRRQQPMGRYILDFVCFEQKLIIELDGGQHAEAREYDAQRDAWLQQQGFRVLRFWNNEWSEQSEAVMESIWQALQEKKGNSRTDTPPLPGPLPRGEREKASGANTPHLPHVERKAAGGMITPLSPRERGVGGRGVLQ